MARASVSFSPGGHGRTERDGRGGLKSGGAPRERGRVPPSGGADRRRGGCRDEGAGRRGRGEGVVSAGTAEDAAAAFPEKKKLPRSRAYTPALTRCAPMKAKHSGRARREQPASAALWASRAQASKFASTLLVAVIWATATRVFRGSGPAACDDTRIADGVSATPERNHALAETARAWTLENVSWAQHQIFCVSRHGRHRKPACSWRLNSKTGRGHGIRSRCAEQTSMTRKERYSPRQERGHAAPRARERSSSPTLASLAARRGEKGAQFCS